MIFIISEKCVEKIDRIFENFGNGAPSGRVIVKLNDRFQGEIQKKVYFLKMKNTLLDPLSKHFNLINNPFKILDSAFKMFFWHQNDKNQLKKS